MSNISIETLNKRIENCKLNIEKLEKKLTRILKAEESNYELNNPYYYNGYDKKHTLKEIEEAKANLIKYESQLQQAQEKASSRNVQVIIDFLQAWKNKVYNLYERAIIEASKMYKELKSLYPAYGELDYENKMQQYDILYKEYNQKLNGIYEYREYIDHKLGISKKHKVKIEDGEWEFINNSYYTPRNIEEGLSKLKKDLDKEADAKYDLIIKRTNQIVGQITDTNSLSIGGNGELNGIVIGTITGKSLSPGKSLQKMRNAPLKVCT